MVTVSGFLKPPADHPYKPDIPGITEFQILGIKLVVPVEQRQAALDFVDRYLRDNRHQLEGLSNYDLVITAE